VVTGVGGTGLLLFWGRCEVRIRIRISYSQLFLIMRSPPRASRQNMSN
jgi:hypothetical protein